MRLKNTMENHIYQETQLSHLSTDLGKTYDYVSQQVQVSQTVNLNHT